MNKDYQSNEVEVEAVPDVTPTEQVSKVVDDFRALVRAELNYFRSRLDYSGQVLKRSALYGGIAIFALFGAVIALATGSVMTLATLVGPGWATLAVTLALVIIGSIFGVQARNWVRKVYFPEIEKHDDDSA